MNFVLVKHPNDSSKYLFRVPESETIVAGTLVAVDTVRGEQPAICVTSSFHADPDVLCRLWDVNPERLKRVTKVLREFELEWGQSDARQE